ncbi:MAG TPA: TIGR00730 family Rossman fold protein [Candidatus Nitrosopolaris sp.]|nr:TIGR00730 family Rossman fold protein [Candidatus Nitrosopolaris sp.]
MAKERTTRTPTRGPRRAYSTGDAELDRRLNALVEELDLAPVDARSTYELLVTAIRMAEEPLSRLDRKLINASVKEMRYAFNVFSKYRDRKKVSVFGSARTPTGDPNYELAKQLGRRMAEAGWMVVTGAGPGIMSAANEGAGQESSFGVNIVLPFEAKPNPFIASDPKLINFKYFFTRKLMFMKEAEAFVLFPGGFGTLDELFELLTLSQTGKSDLHPIVMIEADTGYWPAIDRTLNDVLLTRGYIDREDAGLYYLTESVDDAVAHIQRFYRIYHSQRYVDGKLILRLNTDIPDEKIDQVSQEFNDILRGPIQRVGASSGERQDGDVPDLPRLKLDFDRSHFGRLRQLIDRLNE